MQLTSEVFEVADLETAIEFCYERKWTDGLPVVPPTRTSIERILTYLKCEGSEVVGVVPPRNGVATVEKICNQLHDGRLQAGICTTGHRGSRSDTR